MRRLLVAYLLSALSGTSVSGASPDGPGQIFAACKGRLSADVEFGWLLGRHDRVADALRVTFDGLEAATPAARGSQTRRDVRIVAKADQARLRQHARFHPDDRRRRLADVAANAHRRACEALVLG